MTLFKNKRSAIGLDVGSRITKAAQLRMSDQTAEIIALAAVPRLRPGVPLDSEEIGHLRRILRRQGFTGHRVVLAVPEEKLLRGIFDLPPRVNGAPVAQLARMELSRIHHVEPGSFELIHWGASASGAGNTSAQTVAVACPHEAATELLDTMEASGLDVQALDVRTAATARVCKSLTLASPALTAVLDLGWSSAKLLFVSGAAVVYERLLKCELGKLVETLSRRFRLSNEAACQVIDAVGLTRSSAGQELDPGVLEAIQQVVESHLGTLVEELQTPFSYASHQYHQAGIQRLLLTGGGARIPGLPDYLQERLSLEVLRAAPSDLLPSVENQWGKADDPAVTVAVGLALFTEM
jgi:type IV pilus assembly protein PilM